MKPPLGPQDHVLGSMDAPLELVEYGDFQCPHCGRAYPIVDELRREYGPRLRFAYRHFPLGKMHPLARPAAEASEAAAAAGKFWEMHSALYLDQKHLEKDDLLEKVRAIGLDAEAVAKALNEHTYAPRVQEDLSSGVRSGVNGTPSFFINGKRFSGGYEREALKAALDAAVAGGPATLS
jgi:protein-disulfide isomerase